MSETQKQPRPTFTSTQIALRCAQYVGNELREWANGYEEFGVDFEEFPAKVVFSFVHSEYNVALALTELAEHGYPVDDELYSLLRKAASHRISAHTEAVRAWVMKNAVRLPKNTKEGGMAKFRIGNTEIAGKIAAVIPSEARIVVGLPNGANISVVAEDIISVRNVKNGTQPNPSSPPHNGGTPVAATVAA